MNKIIDIMTYSPACCLPDESLQSVARLMVIHDCGEIPVVNNMDDKRVIGVITDRDICCRSTAQGLNALDLSVRDCMTSPAITANCDIDFETCFNLMEENQIRRVPIIDDKEKCCGMISVADIARHIESAKTGEVMRYISNSSCKNPVYVS